MIIPAGHRVLVKQDVFDEKDDVYKNAKALGIVIQHDKTVKNQESVDTGTILAIGKTAWKDFGDTPWAKVGDKVVYARFAGKKIEDPADKETCFVIINDEDVVAVVKE